MRDLIIAALAAATFQNSAALIVNSFVTTGHQLGVMDSHGNEVMPAKYSTIRYIGHGLYLVRDIAAGLVPGQHWYLFNRDGRQLNLSLPAGCELTGIYSLGIRAPRKTDLPFYAQLPKDSVLVISDGRSFGLCDTRGKVLLPCKYGFIDTITGGRGLIFENSLDPLRANEFNHDGRSFYYDIAGQTLRLLALKGVYYVAPEYSDGMRLVGIKNEDSQSFGYIDVMGKLVCQPKYDRATNFQNGKAIVTVCNGRRTGDFFVIDKQGQRLSASDLLVRSRWHSTFVVDKPSEHIWGLMNDKLEWILKEQNTVLHEFFFGTFRVGDRIVDSDGKEVAEDNLYNRPFRIRLVPKLQAADALHAAAPLFIWGNPFAGEIKKVEKNGLVALYPYGPGLDSAISILPEDISEPEAAGMFPRFAVARAGEGRFVMHEQVGTVGFDSTCFKTKKYGHPFRLELFSSFLHEYDLFKLSKKEVCDLLQQYPSKDPDLLEVVLQSGGCLPEYEITVEIHFSGDRVKSWNFVSYGGPFRSDPVTEDVILVPQMISSRRER